MSYGVNEIFKEMEELCWFKKITRQKVTKEDITTKDGHLLTQKQANCLYNYFDLDQNQTLEYIQSHNYSEISKFIGQAISEWKKEQGYE